MTLLEVKELKRIRPSLSKAELILKPRRSWVISPNRAGKTLSASSPDSAAHSR
jgi:hypothetical protein